MRICVVICTNHLWPFFKDSVEAIFRNKLLPDEFLLVDQCDEPNDLSELKSLCPRTVLFKYFRDEGSGLSRARNIAYMNTACEIIAYTDDDARVGEFWIQCISEAFQTYPNLGILGGRVRAIYQEINPNWRIPEEYRYVLPEYFQETGLGDYLEGALPAGVSFSIRSELLKKVGGFDPYLGVNSARSEIQLCGEDSDMVIKVKALGYDVWYHPECIVDHPVPLTRQNEAFLEKRLMSEGATQACLKYRYRKLSFLSRVYYTLRFFWKIFWKKDLRKKYFWRGYLAYIAKPYLFEL